MHRPDQKEVLYDCDNVTHGKYGNSKCSSSFPEEMEIMTISTPLFFFLFVIALRSNCGDNDFVKPKSREKPMEKKLAGFSCQYRMIRKNLEIVLTPHRGAIKQKIRNHSSARYMVSWLRVF